MVAKEIGRSNHIFRKIDNSNINLLIENIISSESPMKNTDDSTTN